MHPARLSDGMIDDHLGLQSVGGPAPRLDAICTCVQDHALINPARPPCQTLKGRQVTTYQVEPVRNRGPTIFQQPCTRGAAHCFLRVVWSRAVHCMLTVVVGGFWTRIEKIHTAILARNTRKTSWHCMLGSREGTSWTLCSSGCSGCIRFGEHVGRHSRQRSAALESHNHKSEPANERTSSAFSLARSSAPCLVTALPDTQGTIVTWHEIRGWCRPNSSFGSNVKTTEPAVTWCLCPGRSHTDICTIVTLLSLYILMLQQSQQSQHQTTPHSPSGFGRMSIRWECRSRSYQTGRLHENACRGRGSERTRRACCRACKTCIRPGHCLLYRIGETRSRAVTRLEMSS